jgi:uncharacterized protein with LGFP repeats
MTGQKSRRRMVIQRMVICLLAASVALLLSPIAAAQPDADANAAITAAWEASGGDGGTLGPKNGDVYRAGQGFGQNFAGGKIFFTPETGARIMWGAILEKYESLGGPADSDLGFPTIDEGAGRAPESRNTTFSATDKPVIFFTPATGARVVRGPINAAWDKLGGSAGVLGVPAEDEAYRGDVITQKFTNGELSFNTGDKKFTTVPPDLAAQLSGLQFPDDPAAAINAARRAAGGALGPLGAAQGPPYSIGKDGLGQNFAGGKIFYTPATGANVVTGQVLAKYESVGGPEGDLGFPTSSEVDGGLATASRMTTFAAEDKPVIFWTPDYGATIVRGAMSAAWERLDGAKGPLGAPTADQTEAGDVITQRFSEGVVSWDRSNNTFTTEPPNLASELSGLDVPGQNVPEAPGAPPSSDSNGDKWFKLSWWWLLAILPVVALIGLVAFATMRRRGRGEDPFATDTPFAMDSARFGDGGDEHAFGTAGAPERTPPDDDYATAMFSDRYARESFGALPPRRSDVASVDVDPWGARPAVDDEEPPAPVDEPGPPAPVDEPELDEPELDEPELEEPELEEPGLEEPGLEEPGLDEDTDAVDTAPTRVPTLEVERDPLIDTGRHARIEVDEPTLLRTAFLLPLEDPNEVPEGYPIKANTKLGVYWTPGSAMYDDAGAEVWFATEELARLNGFVADGEPR